ncbi:zeta toxin family protein [Streptomyces sp. NPDC054786]
MRRGAEEVLTGTVLPGVLDGAVPKPDLARPVVVFVAGQPGSGKTSAVKGRFQKPVAMVPPSAGIRGYFHQYGGPARTAAHPRYDFGVTRTRIGGRAVPCGQARREHHAVARQSRGRVPSLLPDTTEPGWASKWVPPPNGW